MTQTVRLLSALTAPPVALSVMSNIKKQPMCYLIAIENCSKKANDRIKTMPAGLSNWQSMLFVETFLLPLGSISQTAGTGSFFHLKNH